MFSLKAEYSALISFLLIDYDKHYCIDPLIYSIKEDKICYH